LRKKSLARPSFSFPLRFYQIIRLLFYCPFLHGYALLTKEPAPLLAFYLEKLQSTFFRLRFRSFDQKIRIVKAKSIVNIVSQGHHRASKESVFPDLHETHLALSRFSRTLLCICVRASVFISFHRSALSGTSSLVWHRQEEQLPIGTMNAASACAAIREGSISWLDEDSANSALARILTLSSSLSSSA
jgi:hypothetical protein